MDGQTFLALGTAFGFGRCPNQTAWDDGIHSGVVLYHPNPNGPDFRETCRDCGAKIAYPPEPISRRLLEALEIDEELT